jgi:predicted permease
VRAALGAGWRRIAHLVLAEAAVVSAGGGALGIACAWYAVHAFARFAPAELPRGHAIALEVPVLAAAILLSAVVTLLSGVIPATTGGRVHPGDTLRERRAGHGHTIARHTGALLVATQVAVAVAVLVAAGVVLRSFETLAHDQLGFRPDHLIIARFGQNQSVGNLNTFNDVLEGAIQRARVLPGVRSATGLIAPPFRTAGNDLAYSLPGDEPNAATNRPMVDYLGAGPDYFPTLGIAVVRGRLFTAADGRGASPVAVVDELLAREAWPGKDPIGQQIGVGTSFYTVVGVVAPTRYRDVLAPRATLYTPYAQSSLSPTYIAVRTTGNPAAMVPALRDAVHAFDPRIYLADFASMTDRVGVSLVTQRLEAQLLGGFAAAILLLTAVALYSVGATFVRYREFEIGVRAALGATPAQAARLVVRQGVVVMACGVGAGVLLALAAGTVLRAIVYEVSPRDPLAFIVAIGVVCGAGVLAFFVPSRRAARTNAATLLHNG